MTHKAKIHPAAKMYADEFKAGLLDRREFLTRVSALGVATASAYTMGGLTHADGSARDERPTLLGLDADCLRCKRLA